MATRQTRFPAHPDAVRRMVEETLEGFGRLDVLVNNAGIFEKTPFGTPDYADWQAGWKRVLDTNLMSAVPPGSYLALSHVASDIEPEKMAAMRDRLNRLVAQKGTYRTRDEVTRFFHGLELVEPGMVRIQQWRPDSEIQAKSAAAMWGGVGRKP